MSMRVAVIGYGCRGSSITRNVLFKLDDVEVVAVCDEYALAEAIKNDSIGGLGIDVYSTEPFSEEHPFYEIKSFYHSLL